MYKRQIIAHAGVDDGVYSMGMALLKLPEKLSFNGYMDADIIVVLATPDKTRHLPAAVRMPYGLHSASRAFPG